MRNGYILLDFAYLLSVSFYFRIPYWLGYCLKISTQNNLPLYLRKYKRQPILMVATGNTEIFQGSLIDNFRRFGKMSFRQEVEESISNLGKLDEEFNNFLYRVNQVDSIVRKLASSDKDTQKLGDEEAKQYLGEDKETILENLDENKLTLKVAVNRTIVNKKALINEDKNPNEMSQQAFMDEVSKDADRRYKERLVRTEKMETFKKQATSAFRRGDYERALVLYNKAIEQIKDSTLLYNNRALTYIKLGLYEKAKNDLKEWALRINEDCLKSWLLLAKSHFMSGELKDFEESVLEAKKRNPQQIDFIKDYIKELQRDREATLFSV